MPWWGWMILGTLLLGSELLGVDAAFYLLFVGLAAVATGFVTLALPELAPWVEWLIFAGFALVFMVVFRKRVYKRFRGVDVDYPTGPEGEFVTLEAALAPGARGRQRFRGTQWTVVNEGANELPAGARAKVIRVESLTLVVAGE